ncbi:MAG: HD domain-containing phosphohydrolase [Cyanophyceae cyanobacterium]
MDPQPSTLLDSPVLPPESSASGDNAGVTVTGDIARRLIEVGIALSAELDLSNLLFLIVSKAQELTSCDRGTLYLRDGDHLQFFLSDDYSLQDQSMPLTPESIAGFVVLNGKALNIPDVYALSSELPYRFNPSFDQLTGYHTQSILTVPMRDPSGQIVGALQLINRQDPIDRTPISFSAIDISVAEALASQAAVAHHNVRLQEELKSAYFETITCLSMAAEYRDHDTALHIKRMSNYSRIIAKYLGLSPQKQELILYASPMHDVGKIGIPDAILLKPGPLTPEERQVIQQHPEIGYKILGQSTSEVMKLSALIALTHHERFDGSGYPRGLAGDEIPLEGRIVALADVFDALSSRRPYKKPWGLEEVYALIDRDTGTHFDPVVVRAFREAESEIMAVYHLYQEEMIGDG